MSATVKVVHQIVDRHSHLGEQNFEGGRIVCPRTRLAPFANLHYIFPPATDDQIASIALTTGRQPRPEFRQLLSIHNGMNLFGGSLSIYGVREHYNRDIASAQWLPFDLGPENWELSEVLGREDMVIGGIGNDGRLILRHDGQIVRFERSSATIEETWDSIALLLGDACEHFSQFYDSEGYRIQNTVHTIGKSKPRADLNMYELSKKADLWPRRLYRWLRGR